ncbi:hypothetical protein [Rikenella microfusus]|uniref:hypothetical protein n=1 Tax=Rikenella microfusus TaxID=28139 RepID=UPI001DAF8B32|nr:hypothetical protein [Rikenella microfusus]HJE88787.1 hypothetical protein [Rikenella microfusus]
MSKMLVNGRLTKFPEDISAHKGTVFHGICKAGRDIFRLARLLSVTVIRYVPLLPILNTP